MAGSLKMVQDPCCQILVSQMKNHPTLKPWQTVNEVDGYALAPTFGQKVINAFTAGHVASGHYHDPIKDDV